MENGKTLATHPDRRINAYREDLADDRLKDLVAAPRYVVGRPARITAANAQLHRGPDRDMPIDSELIYGDEILVFDQEGMWAWVQNDRDRYVGYLPIGCLSFDPRQATHKITALATFAYGKPDIKTPLPYRLYMNSRIQVVAEVDKFVQLADGRYVPKRHVGDLNHVADDFVSVAERYLETPYLWGGCTVDGIDCSGLVQAACEFAGLVCPRDSDMQQQIEGRDLDLGGMEELRRGDLVFWKGHVAIMVNDMMLLHANATSMDVRIETFHKVVGRIAADGGGDLVAIRRPSALSGVKVS